MNKKTQRIIAIIYLLTLMVMLSGATFAYFTVIKVSNVSPRVEATSARMLASTITSGKPIAISASHDNFNIGMGSLSDSTDLTIDLDAGTSDASMNYSVYLTIEKNNLEYTTDNNQAELIMKLYDPDGVEVTSIKGLEYVESNGYSGFDITTKIGQYILIDSYEITANANEESKQVWNIEVTLINLDSSQNDNIDKKFEGHIVAQGVD